MRDYGYKQQRTLADFDGNTWHLIYMDMSILYIEQIHIFFYTLY